MKVVPAVLLFCLTVGSASAQGASDEWRKGLRAALESDYKKITEDSIKELFAHQPGASEKEKSLAIQGIKTMLYNKAYGQYRCALANPTAPQQIKECSQKQAETLAFYSQLIASVVAPRSMKCEMQHRLFEAETEFPPFSFFGEAQLYDFAELIECYRTERV